MSLRNLRRQVRRNSDLPAPARLFFEDVCDMHAGQGCFASDAWFAQEYGVHEKTIERYRTTLKKAGVLTWYEADGKRHLQPVTPTGGGDRGGDKSVPQGQNPPSGTKSSPQNPLSRDESVPEGTKVSLKGRKCGDESVPAHRVNNNSSLRSESAGESAHTREDELDDQPDGGSHDFDPVGHIEERWDVEVGSIQADEIRTAITDEDRWRAIVQRFRRQGDTQRRKVAWALNDYEHPNPKTDDHANPDQRDDPDGRPRSPSGYDYDQHIEPAY